MPPQPVQQASVAPTTRPPGVSNAAGSKAKALNTSPPRPVTAVPSGKSASPGNSAVHVVRRGDTLNKISKRGQVIAHSGQTGNVNPPQLHFEVRRGAIPLDPIRFLKS